VTTPDRETWVDAWMRSQPADIADSDGWLGILAKALNGMEDAAYERGLAEGGRQATEGLTLQHEDEQWSIWWHSEGGGLNVSVPDESEAEPETAAWAFQASVGGEVKRRRRVLLVGEWEPAEVVEP